MASQIFVNLPIQDLTATNSFFAALGFEFNPMFSNEVATCMLINEHAFVMLLTTPFFGTFTPKPISLGNESTEVIMGISVETREKVNEMAEKAISLGGTEARDPQDHGFMFTRSFHDLDGHIWEVFWMDPNGIPEAS